LIARDGQQPATEGSTGRVVSESAARRRDRAEHLLNQVGGIGVLEPPAPPIRKNQRAVDINELGPGRTVRGVTQPAKQARAGCGRLDHDDSIAGEASPLSPWRSISGPPPGDTLLIHNVRGDSTLKIWTYGLVRSAPHARWIVPWVSTEQVACGDTPTTVTRAVR